MTLLELQSEYNGIVNKSKLDELLGYLDETNKYGDLFEKTELLDFLSQYLSKYGNDVENLDDSLYEALQVGWLNIAFTSFPGLTQEDQSNLLQKRLFAAMQKGFEPDAFIRSFYDFFETEDMTVETLKSLVKDLEANTETFGKFADRGRRQAVVAGSKILDFRLFKISN